MGSSVSTPPVAATTTTPSTFEQYLALANTHSTGFVKSPTDMRWDLYNVYNNTAFQERDATRFIRERKADLEARGHFQAGCVWEVRVFPIYREGVNEVSFLRDTKHCSAVHKAYSLEGPGVETRAVFFRERTLFNQNRRLPMFTGVSTEAKNRPAVMDVSTDDMEDVANTPVTPPRLVRKSGELSPLRSGPWPISPIAALAPRAAGAGVGPTGTPVRATGPTSTPVASRAVPHRWGFDLIEEPTEEQATAVASRFTAAIDATVAAGGAAPPAAAPGAPIKAPRPGPSAAALQAAQDLLQSPLRRLDLSDIQINEEGKDQPFDDDLGNLAWILPRLAAWVVPPAAGVTSREDDDDSDMSHELSSEDDEEYQGAGVPSVGASPVPTVYGRKRVYALPPSDE